MTDLVDVMCTADQADLYYVNDEIPGISRRRCGKGFTYKHPDGKTVTKAERRRIDALVIPPAWTDVWICPIPDGHLQVTARDARGRKQYRYHPVFRERRDETKFARMLALSSVIQRIRERVEHDIGLPGLPRAKVMATLVWLLERTLIRVGTAEYARENDSFGLTTLRRRRVVSDGAALRFEFRGKSGVSHAVSVADRRIVRIVQQCRELRGYELFKYIDDDGAKQTVEAEDVNAYLREMGPARTKKEAERNVVRAVDLTASHLGNTRSVCRKYYIHPVLIDAYLRGDVLPPQGAQQAKERRGAGGTLRRHEAETLAFLTARIENPSVEPE